MQLSDFTIRAAKPPATGYITLWDSRLKGFGCMIGHGGTRSFCVLIASGRRKVIGKYPLLGVADARRIAREMLAEKVLRHTLPKRHAFDDAKHAYLEAVGKRNKPRTLKDYTRLLDRHYRFGRKNLADIAARDIIKNLSSLPPIERRYAQAVGKAFFRWCLHQHLLDQSPMANIAPAPAGKPRERALSEDELRAVYTTAREGNSHFHRIVTLLVLTGARRSEVAGLRWDWIGADYIEWPPEAVKNGRRHRIPIGPAAQHLLSSLPMLSDTYVFPAARIRSDTTTVHNSWSKPLVRFRTELADKGFSVAPFQLHDLRRTLSSFWAAEPLSIPQVVTEKYLNHVSGGVLSPIAATYNRHTYYAEMARAALRWEAYLATLSMPKGA